MGRGMLAGRDNNDLELKKNTHSRIPNTSKVNPIFSTCDVENNLDFLVSGRSDSSHFLVPLGAQVRLRVGVLLLLAQLTPSCGKSRLKISIVLGALKTPAVAPPSWYWY